MRAKKLLKEIEPLPFGERCRRLADLRDSPDLDRLLDELGGGAHYERSIALFIAAAARHREHLARAMRDPDAELAAQAMGQAAKFGVAPEVFEAVLADAPSAVRAAAYEGVHRWRRADVAERLIGPAEETVTLLPVCGERVARERLARMARLVRNWKSFGHAHPGVMLDHAESVLAELPDAQKQMWLGRHGPGIAAAARHEPSRVVGLLERHWTITGLPFDLHPLVGTLLDAEPGRMLALLLTPGHERTLRSLLGARGVRDRVTALGDDDLTRVARATGNDSGMLRLLLSAFPPGRRERVFELAMTGVDRTVLEFDDALLDVLPRAARHREARRMLGLRRVAESPRRSLEVLAFLPYDEAAPVLAEVTGRQDADDRALGYRLLIDCAGRERDPRVITRLLDSLGRLRNEQDPVRMPAIAALARVPDGSLRPEHGPRLERIADDAIKARDCSWSTRQELSALATSVCREGAVLGDPGMLVMGLEIIQKLAGTWGSLTTGRLATVLRRGQEHELVARLAPYLAKARRRNDYRLTFLLARGLGRRAHDVEEIQKGLEEAALSARDDGVITTATGYWLAPPRTRAERVGRLVAKDPSVATRHQVFAVIARERTDLLHLVLDGQPPAGRFWKRDVVYVPSPERVWMRRWTARQRGDYIALLQLLAEDAGQTLAVRADAVRAIGQVPGAGFEELRPFLRSRRSGEDAVLLRRTALTAAPWIATPQDVLPLLLDEAASDDAHVAMYAASRAVRFVRPSALAEALAPVLTDGKITARKEALRILLREHVPNAMNIIAAAWDEPSQHRDVRAAIASALRPHLHDPTAERILTEAARAEPGIARQLLGSRPLEFDDPARYAALVLRVAGSDDVQTRDAALWELPVWASWSPAIAPFLAGLVTNLDETASWETALTALIGCAVHGVGTGVLADAASRLAASPPREDAEPERDLPALQRLERLADALAQAALNATGDRARPALRALSGRLPEPLDAWLTAATLRWDDDAAAALDALADRPLGGVLATERVADALNSDYLDDWSLPDPEDVHPHATRLAARGDLAGGLFACVLTELHGERAGWDREWRELLRALRAHPNPDVAYRARTVLTALE
ncbi:hypothetical protein [Spirillospora sp. CA-294931]|uniref:hypothetical protein n=1 Tax=Spirillospora sp. CA-294931 TaxID=3240042 RepID=UPI003D93D857